MMQELKSERRENLKPHVAQFDNNDEVERCLDFHGANRTKFVDWSTNTVEIFNACPHCGRLIDVMYNACRYCWAHGCNEDGETYEGDY